MIFVRGGRLGLPGSSRVALAWHTAMGNTPFGVTSAYQRAATQAPATRCFGSVAASSGGGVGERPVRDQGAGRALLRSEVGRTRAAL